MRKLFISVTTRGTKMNSIIGDILLTLFLCLSCVKSQGISNGLVIINSTTPTVPAAGFIFNENSGSGSIPVYLTTNGAPSTISSNSVSITCEQTPPAASVGFTSVIFNPVTVTPAVSISASVTFSIQKSGRAVNIRCYGITLGFTPTIINGTQTTFPQFTRTTSISQPRLLTVTKAPTVELCYTDFVSVPNMNSVTSSQFNIELSEPVSGANVTITCSQTATGVTDGLVLNIPSVKVAIGNSKSVVPYSIVTRGSEVFVQCQGQSDTGNQFLNSNSIGVRKKFVQRTGAAQFLPETAIITSNQFQVSLVLDSSLSISGLDVNFECSLIPVSDTIHARFVSQNAARFCYTQTSITPGLNNTSTAPTPSVSSSTTPSNTASSTTGAPTSGAPTTGAPTTSGPVLTTQSTTTASNSSWSLTPSSMTFIAADGESYKLISISRSQRAPSARVSELLTVVCCSPSDNNQNPKYQNVTATMIIAANLYPEKPINFTASPVKETVLQNPAFVEVSPCTCDLTVNQCDNNCCCDRSCTGDDNSTFHCFTGIYGGTKQDSIPDHKCEANDRYDAEQYDRFMCVWRETNAWLGYYHLPQNKISTQADITTKLTSINESNWRESSFIKEPPVSGVDFKYGSELTTVIYSDGIVKYRGSLSLPQRYLSRECLTESPVRYLIDKSSNCQTEISKLLCENRGSRLNARMYAMGTNKRPCSTPVRISTTYNGLTPLTVDASYYCATDLNSYIINTGASSAKQPLKHSLFKGLNNVTGCSFRGQKFVCQGGVEQLSRPVPNTLPARCSFDDGLTEPPEPVWDSINNVCRNSVIDVNYQFQWSGSTLTKLTARYVLADVPVETTINETIQTVFTVLENKTISGNTTELNVTKTTTSTNTITFSTILNQKYKTEFKPRGKTQVSANLYQPFSGNSGYDIDKPLIAGVGVYNNQNSLTRIDASRSVNIFLPTADGLCSNSRLTEVPFAIDVSSACFINLKLSDFNDCQYLKELILANLNAAMPADFIAPIGNPDLTKTDAWIPIIRENIINYIRPTSASTNATTAPPISTTVDPGQRAFYEPYDVIKGQCENITTGINLQVIYSQTGEIKGKSIYRIMGAYINYTISSIDLSCSGTESKRCLPNSQQIEPFQLTSTVQFIKVNGLIPYPPTQNHTVMRRAGICWWDVCDEHVLFPLLPEFQGDSREYTLAMGLLLTFLFIWFYIFVCFPWKHLEP
ncbi:uncharacterized protein LOC141900426 isoform X2 [Tubulanus polymorphus]|uniref:uncharacterized protein LOC141900426 isoform X2 n=1 Tax=Tubulanus polymorphus TaxID=672921 RepID=UPI003DA65A8F